MLIPKELLPICKLASKESGRYAYNAILAERLSAEKVRLVETDGSQLLMVDYLDMSADFPMGEFDATAREGFSTLLPTKALEEAGKSIPKSSMPILGNVAVNESPNGKLSMATTDLETTRRFETKPMEGKFPYYSASMPTGAALAHEGEERKMARIGVNPKLLARVLETMAAMLGDRLTPVIELLVPLSGTTAIVMKATTSNGAEITALVMPCRLKETPTGGAQL